MLIRQELVQESEKRSEAFNIDDTPNNDVRPAQAVRATRVARMPPQTKPISMEKRRAHLSYAGAVPSNKELERLLNGDDLVDEFYLQRALVAAKPVSRLLVCNE